MFQRFIGKLFERMSPPPARRHGAAQRKPGSYRPELLDLESRTLLSTIAWLRPVGGDWDDPANWVGGRVPVASDDAVIPFAGIQVTHATAAADSAHSLTSEAALDLSAGSLALGSTAFGSVTASRIDDLFTVDGGPLTLNHVALGGAGTLRNLATVNLFGSTVNVGVRNEAGVLAATGQVTSAINNQADQPLVNGPGATLRVLGRAGLTVANGFTNEGGIEVQTIARFSTAFDVGNGTLVNAPGGTIHLGGSTNSSAILNADLDNQGLLTAGNVVFSKPSGTVTNSGTIRTDFGTASNQAFTNSGEITINTGGTFTVSGGTFDQNGSVDGPGTLALSGTTASFPGDLSNAVTGLSVVNTTLNTSGTLTNVGTLDISGSTINAPLVNQGTLRVRDTGAPAVLNGPFTNQAGATLTIGGSLTVAQGFTNDGEIDLATTFQEDNATLTVASGTLTNAPGATIAVQAGAGGFRFLNAQLDNQGTLTVAQGTILTGGVANSGTIDVQAGDLTVDLVDPAAPFANTGTVTVESLRALLVEGGDFTNAGVVTVGSFGMLLVTGGYTQTDGQTLLDNGALTASGLVDLEGGILTGSGTVNANVLNNAEVDVGQPDSPGVLTINGDYTQTAGAVLVIEIGGPNPGTDFDQLAVTGQAALDGTLTVNLINGFVPNSGDSFQVLTFGSGTGAFANLNADGGLFTPNFDPGDVTLVAN